MSIQTVRTNFIFSFRVLGKGIWRDLVNVKRYKVALIGWILSIVIGLGAGYLFGVLFNFNDITSDQSGLTPDQVFVFFSTGIALSAFGDSALWAPLGRIENDIHYGTLEAVFVTPANRLPYLLSPSIADSILNLIFFLPAYIIIMGVNGSLTDIYIIGTTLLVVFLTIFSMISFGLFFAMFGILIRRSRAIASFLNIIFQFICGAYVPVQAFIGINALFGKGLQYFAMIFPYTYCFDLMRYFTFGETYIPLLPIWLEFLMIFLFSIFFITLGTFLLKFVERRAKKTGLSLL